MTVDGLKRNILSRLTNDNAHVAVTARTGTAEVADHQLNTFGILPVIHRGRSLTTHDQSPAFKLVSTHSTKAVDGMLSVTFWRLVYDHAEIVMALGAVSSDVLSHSVELISPSPT